MKKIITTITITMIIIITIIIISNSKPAKKKSSKTSSKIPYYNEKFKSRYQKYRNTYPNLSEKDIITRVNIGLDNSYYTNTKVSPFLNKTYILVNKYIYLPSDYIPKKLEILNEEYSRSGMKLVKEAKVKLEEMITAAKKDNYQIRVMSSYRDYNYQLNLYNEYKKLDGKEKADTYSARPGFSEHQTGLCIDIDDGIKPYTSFENTASFKWMNDNSYKYGFILRYPKDKEKITGYSYESWHYRYVGEKIAKYMHKHNLTLDEYYVRFIEKQ